MWVRGKKRRLNKAKAPVSVFIEIDSEEHPTSSPCKLVAAQARNCHDEVWKKWELGKFPAGVNES